MGPYHSGVAYHGPSGVRSMSWSTYHLKQTYGLLRNMLFLFRGSYWVWEFRAEECTRPHSLMEVAELWPAKIVEEL